VDGTGAWGFTAQFIQMWKMLGGHLTHPDEAYRSEWRVEGRGFCQPLTDGPENNPDAPIEDTYLQMIATAKRELFITTPYYAVEESMQRALCIAADAGVDVRLVVPAIPDHKLIYLVAETYWGELMSRGVKIYQYTPGFIHAKSVMADGEVGLVGTTNMDYRTFALQYECAVLMYQMDAVDALRQDLLETMEKSRRYTMEEWKARPWYLKAFATLLKVFDIWF
jgi:cardiolipin synthase